MSNNRPEHDAPRPRLEPGQTILFLGEHTSPDDPGYVGVISQVLARFHPGLAVRLISAGGKGHTALALRSRALMDLLTSSRPDWIAIAIGWADALREPALPMLMSEYERRMEGMREDQDDAIGAERGESGDMPRGPTLPPDSAPDLQRLEQFSVDLAAAIAQLVRAGVRPILITPAFVGSDLQNPLNIVLKAYGRAIRQLAREQQAALVDVDQAFRDVVVRAATYKQTVSFATAQGQLTPQGTALVARTFLSAFGLLPGPGSRPR